LILVDGRPLDKKQSFQVTQLGQLGTGDIPNSELNDLKLCQIGKFAYLADK
jgi:hypothetical protein